jgi:hypothetical protein
MDINEFEIEAHRRIEVEIELKQKHMDKFSKKFNIPKREFKFKIMSSLHSKIHDYFQHHSGRIESGFMTLRKATSKWHFFLGFPNGSPKIGTHVIWKLWMFISSSNQAFLEHMKKPSYSPENDIFNSVLHAPIENHLTSTLRGFVVGTQIPNLTPASSFDHNSCILGLNEH